MSEKWISVKDRLPRVGDLVRVRSITHGEIKGILGMYKMTWDNGRKVLLEWVLEGLKIANDITHWMSKHYPEPPQDKRCATCKHWGGERKQGVFYKCLMVQAPVSRLSSADCLCDGWQPIENESEPPQDSRLPHKCAGCEHLISTDREDLCNEGGHITASLRGCFKWKPALQKTCRTCYHWQGDDCCEMGLCTYFGDWDFAKKHNSYSKIDSTCSVWKEKETCATCPGFFMRTRYKKAKIIISFKDKNMTNEQMDKITKAIVSALERVQL